MQSLKIYSIVKYSRLTLLTFLVTVSTSAPSIGLIVPSESLRTDNRQHLVQNSQAREAEAERLYQQGSQQDQNGQLNAAIKSFQQALTIYQELGDQKGQLRALGKLGLAYYALRDYDNAIKFLQPFLTISQELKQRQGEEIALMYLGSSYLFLKKYAAAVKYYQPSLTIAREIPDVQGEGIILSGLGIAYDNLGEYTKAIESYDQLLDLSQKVGNPQIKGLAELGLGNTFDHLGDEEQALKFYNQGLKTAQSTRNRQLEGRVRGGLGNVSISQGNYQKAIEYYQQSFLMARETQDLEGLSNAVGNLGNAYYVNGEYQKALEAQQLSLAIARAKMDKEGESEALSGLGLAYEGLGQYDQAIASYQQQLAIADSTGNQLDAGIALNNLGGAYMTAGKLAEAEKSLRSCIQKWESLRKELKDTNRISIFENQVLTYGLLQKLLILKNQPTAALEIAEQGRARAFVALLASKISQPTPNITSPSIPEIQQIARSQNATLVEYSIIYDDPVPKKPLFRAADLFIWVVKPTGEIAFRKADLKPLLSQHKISLEDLVTKSRESFGVRGRGSSIVVEPWNDGDQTNKNLQQLHQILIQPIADLLPTDANSRLIFLPQAALFLIPFPALQDSSGKYLIEKYTIQTAPSIHALQLTYQRQQQLRSHPTDRKHQLALVVGNPKMPSVSLRLGNPPQALNPLPGSEQEAIAVAQLLNTKAILNQQATKAAILPQLSQVSIIHLATHGLLDDFKGLGFPGAIALAPSGNGQVNDGLLTADEILDLKLNAQLVVLSACDTGRGRITGDGVIGLSRSLITAGVPSVIVSLWSVPDAPTAELMTEFYRNWLSSKIDKAQALRQAMLTTMKNHPPIKDWAAFTLIGEAE